MFNAVKQEKMLYFIIGALSVLAVVLLTAASGGSPVMRYQLEAVVRNNIRHTYVLDTTTGSVKWAAKLNTPFAAMQGQ